MNPHPDPLPKGEGKNGEQHSHSPSDWEAILSASPLFQGLSGEQLAQVAKGGRLLRRLKGEVVIQEGDRGDAMYILVLGKVQVSRTVTLSLSRTSVGEAEKSFVELDSSSHPAFGEMALLEEGSLRGATVTALTDIAMLEIAKDHFEKLCEEDPLLGYRVLRNMATQLSVRLRRSNQDVLKLSSALSLALSRR